VNARTLTLRAPIDGTVSSVPTELAVGATFPSGTALLRITNSRADRTRLDDQSGIPITFHCWDIVDVLM
jgi:hypothetical protein